MAAKKTTEAKDGICLTDTTKLNLIRLLKKVFNEQRDNCGNISIVTALEILGVLIEYEKIQNMSAKHLINWGELSRMLSGSRQTVRKNSIPKIHQPFVKGLLKAIDKELSKLPDTANAGRQNKKNLTTDVY